MVTKSQERGSDSTRLLDRLLTVKEVAAAAQVHPQTVRGWIKDEKLAAVRPGGARVVRVLLSAFRDFVHRSSIPCSIIE